MNPNPHPFASRSYQKSSSDPICLRGGRYCIFQKAFGLIEKRKDQKRQLFQEIVDPVYVELSVVVENYYGFFRSCRDDFSERKAAHWWILVREKKKKREEIVMARNKVLGLTRPFLSAYKTRGGREDVLLYEFAKAIKDFFDASVAPGTGSTVSNFLTYMERVAGDRQEKERQRVIQRIEEHLLKLEQKWGDISGAYGELQVFCLG